MRSTPLIAAGLLMLPVAAAAAEPLPAEWIPAEASWFVHLDVEAALDSTLGQAILEHAHDLDIDLTDLEEVEEELGLDPLEDIFSVTLFGSDDPEDDHTILLQTSMSVDDALAAGRREPGYQQLDVDGHTIHRWNDGKEIYVYVTEGPDPTRRVVILSDHRRRVVRAIDVMEGRRLNLQERVDNADRTAKVPKLPVNGTLLFISAQGMPWMDEEDDDDPAVAIIRRSDQLRLELAETNDLTTIELSVSARSSEDATNIADLLRGMVAMGKLVTSNNVDLADAASMLEDISITARYNNVTVRLMSDSKLLVERLGLLVGGI